MPHHAHDVGLDGRISLLAAFCVVLWYGEYHRHSQRGLPLHMTGESDKNEYASQTAGSRGLPESFCKKLSGKEVDSPMRDGNPVRQSNVDVASSIAICLT